MNFVEMQDRVINLITLGGWSNGYPPPNPALLVNWGKSEFVRYTNDNQETAIIQTVAGQAVYGLTSDLPNFPPGYPLGPRKWYAWNDDALWNILPGSPGRGAYIPQTTREKLRETDAQYLDTPPSVPYSWYKAQDQFIGLYPAPAISGVLIQFSGNRSLLDLQLEEDTLPWHDRYVEACCLFGAYYYGKSQARGEELGTLSRYHAEAKELVAEFNQDSTSKEAALINRRVSPPQQDYLDAGTRVIPSYRTPSGYFPGQG